MIIDQCSNLGSDFPEGAFCPIGSSSANNAERIAIGGRAITVIHHRAIGMCIREYENNYYEDSNFMMIVWDPITKSAHSECFATTRFWCGPSFGSSVDASPELMAEYAIWKVRDDRRTDLLDLRRYRSKMFVKANECGITLKQLKRIRNCYGADLIIELLKIKKFRSAFRESLAKQVRTWLSSESKFPTPLSPKQIECLARY